MVKDFQEITGIPDGTELLVLLNLDAVLAVKESEIQNWRENDIFEEIENCGQNSVSVRWVMNEKIKGEKSATKNA